MKKTLTSILFVISILQITFVCGIESYKLNKSKNTTKRRKNKKKYFKHKHKKKNSYPRKKVRSKKDKHPSKNRYKPKKKTIKKNKGCKWWKKKKKYNTSNNTSWRKQSSTPPSDDQTIKVLSDSLERMTIEPVDEQIEGNYIKYCLSVANAIKNPIDACQRVRDIYTKELENIFSKNIQNNDYQMLLRISLLIRQGAQLECINPRYPSTILLNTQLSFGAQLRIQPNISRAFFYSKQFKGNYLHQILQKLEKDLDPEFIRIFIKELIRICKKYIIAPNMLIIQGKTALHLAVQYELYDIVEHLLVSGAYIDMKSSKGFTPLHFAQIIENNDIIELLKQYNANEDIKPPHTYIGYKNFLQPI